VFISCLSGFVCTSVLLFSIFHGHLFFPRLFRVDKPLFCVVSLCAVLWHLIVDVQLFLIVLFSWCFLTSVLCLLLFSNMFHSKQNISYIKCLTFLSSKRYYKLADLRGLHILVLWVTVYVNVQFLCSEIMYDFLKIIFISESSSSNNNSISQRFQPLESVFSPFPSLLLSHDG